MPYFNTDSSTTQEWDFVEKDSKTSDGPGSESGSEISVTNLPTLPANVQSFFAKVPQIGYPNKKELAQPWIQVWEGIVEPDQNGDLLVACPKKSDFGKHSFNSLKPDSK
ncbi:MAG: hypothetical protein MMC33_003037 [Icmadophila ericetorum]|nr:hypothetical protein [Icmadophila ericetorum]